MKAKLIRALSWAIFPALLVGGFAIAAPGNGGSGDSRAGERLSIPPGPPPAEAGAPPMLVGGDGELTYSEIHLVRDGKPVVLRDDRGTIDAISGDSITITEADDNSVTIPVDASTKVLDPPDQPGQTPQLGSVDDLKAGQNVTVHREEGQPASFIGVVKQDGGRTFFPLPPRPPGAAPDARSPNGGGN